MTQNDVKKRYDGIQTALKMAGDYACLFLSVLSIAEEYTGLPVDFIMAYRKCLELGLIREDFYCKDQEKMLYTFTGKKWKKTIVKKLPDQLPDNTYTIEKWYNKRTNFNHFKRRYFDTLVDSKTVKEGFILGYYCYSVEE